MHAYRTEQGQALAGVFAELSPELTGQLFGVLHNWEDARDATQTAFLKCWQSRDRLGAVRDVRAWLFRIGLNAARDLCRQGWRRRAMPLEMVADTAHEHTRTTPVDEALHREGQDLLRAALRELRPDEREVFVLRREAALSFREIAAARGQPVATVKSQMRAAVRKLGDRLAAREAG